MIRQKIRFVVAILATTGFFWPAVSTGQEKTDTQAIAPGSKIVTVEVIPLRDGPPAEGFFYELGKELGAVKKGEELKVTGVKRVTGLFAEQYWLQVERDTSTLKATEAASGWVYAGKKGEKSCCFAVMR